MAERSVMTGKEYDVKGNPKRRGTTRERLLNALYSGGLEGAMFIPEVLTKGLSAIPGVPSYSFGSATEGIKGALREAGVLTDEKVESGQGSQGYIEDALRAAASGLTGGGVLRGALGAATRNVPRAFGAAANAPLRQQAAQAVKNVLPYDIALPALATVPGRYAQEELGMGPLGRAAIESGVSMGGPAAWGAMRGARFMPGSQARNEQYVLQQMEKLGIRPENIRPSADINLPTFAVGYPELPATASAAERARQASQRGKALYEARRTPAGQEALARQSLENERRIRGLLETGQETTPTLSATAGREIAAEQQDILSSFARPRDTATNQFSQYLLGLYDTAQDYKNQLYGALGDARQLGKVDAAPLRAAMQDVLDTFKSSAMSRGTLKGEAGIQRGGIEDELNRILKKNLELTDEAQRTADAQAMVQWQKQAEANRALMLPDPPLPSAAKVSAQNAPDTVSAQSLMQTYKDINALWQKATPSEKFLLSKLKTGVNETLEQNPFVARAFEEASRNNADFMWMARSTPGNKSPLVNAINARNPEDALQDYMKNVFQGAKSSEDARRLLAVSTQHGDPDEMRMLAMAAIEDQAAQNAYRSVYRSPAEAVSAANKARSFIDSTVNFREALGIPESAAVQTTSRIAQSVEQAEPVIQQLRTINENPSGFFNTLLSATPDQREASLNVLNGLRAADPTVADDITTGITNAVRREFSTPEGGFRFGAAANYLTSPELAPITDFLSPDLRQRVVRASEAQQQLERMRMDSRFGEEGMDKAAMANLAALGGQFATGKPGPFYRAARVVEGIPNMRPGHAEREALMVESLINPQTALDLAARNPTYQSTFATRVLPQAVTAPYRSLQPQTSQFAPIMKKDAAASPMSTEATPDDWTMDEEETAIEKKATAPEDDWSLD